MMQKLSSYINLIKDNKLVLPDFQRGYVWDREKVTSLLHSVLAKNPLGSLLIVENAKPNDYALRKIGTKNETPLIEGDSCDLLIDGQQRITTLLLVFSDLIHSNTGFSTNALANQGTLKDRYFIKIPRPNEAIERAEDDIFNIHNLDFESGSLDNKLSTDFEGLIECLRYKDGDWFKPSSSLNWADIGVQVLSVDDNYYYFPLYILTTTQTASLQGILKSFASNYHSDHPKGDDIYTQWAINVQKYFNDITEELDILELKFQNDSKIKAIDAYEGLNTGGVPLTTFNLLIAKVSDKTTNKTFVELLEDKKETLDKTFFSNNQYDALFEKILPFVASYDSDVKIDLYRKKQALKLTSYEIWNNYEKTQELISKAANFFHSNFGIRQFGDLTNKLMLDCLISVYHIKGSVQENYVKAWYWLSCFYDRYGDKQNQRFIEDTQNLVKDDGEVFSWLNSLKNEFDSSFYKKEYLLMETPDKPSTNGKETRLIEQYYLSKKYNSIVENSGSGEVSVDCEGLQDHHIIPIANISGATRNGSELINSPVNRVLIAGTDNNLISNSKLELTPSSAKYGAKPIHRVVLEELGVNLIEGTDYSNDANVKTLLEGRYEKIKQKVKADLDSLIVN